MTAVLFKFTLPDGTPVADAPFRITTRKPSFDETLHNGIQMPGDVNATTDAQGEATVTLMAGFAIYYLLMDEPSALPDSEGCTAGLRYKFMVTESATPLRIEDLIFTTPTFSRPWDETALQAINDAKATTQAAAVAAEAARDEALEQTGIIDGIAEETRIAAAEALVSRDQAEGFATSASQSKVATAADVLLTHADVLLTHGDVVLTHADVVTTTASKNAAADSAQASQASAQAAEADQMIVVAAKDLVVTRADEVALNTSAVATDTGIVLAAKDVTLTARDQAVEAAGAVVGNLIDKGAIDLSGGAYPVKPTTSAFWKVTVGGTITGEHGDTYGVGDTLVYSKTLDYFYKIDSTDQVSSVNGQSGVVVLGKADIGLSLVDNTADEDKPVSTPQQNALNLKIDKTSIVDALTSTDASKVLSANQGKVLADAAVQATDNMKTLVQNGTLAHINTVAGTNTITGIVPAPFASYGIGQTFYFVAANDNTGAVTLNLNGLGAKALTKFGALPLIAGDIRAGAIIQVQYDGTRFQLGSEAGGGIGQSKLTQSAVSPTTSGTFIEIAGIPPWAKRVTLTFLNISTNGVSQVLVHLGGAAYQASGYNASLATIANAVATGSAPISIGFPLSTGNAANVIAGSISFISVGSGLWVGNGLFNYSNTSAIGMVAGGVAINAGAALERIRLGTQNGTDLFDGGSIVVTWE